MKDLLIALAPYIAGFLALIVVLFWIKPDRVRSLFNLFLAAEAKHIEIKNAEKTGKAPPHVHGLTVSGQDDIRAEDVRAAIRDAQQKRRHSKEKS